MCLASCPKCAGCLQQRLGAPRQVPVCTMACWTAVNMLLGVQDLVCCAVK
jgi:hypothetical protein